MEVKDLSKDKLISNNGLDEDIYGGSQEHVEKDMCSFDEVQDDRAVEVAKQERGDNVRGIVFMILAGMCFSTASITCKIVYMRNEYLNGIDYMLWRSVFPTLISIIQVLSAKVNVFDIKKGFRLLLVFRSVVSVIGMPCYFIAVKYIPLSFATLIYNISPLLVGILSYLILKEQITSLKVISVVGAFTGIFILTFHKDEDYQAGQFYMLGLILVGINCCTQAVNTLTLRALNKEIHYLVSPFWYFATSLILALMILAVYPSAYHFSKFTKIDLTIFLLSTLFAYGGQLFSSKALKYSEASLITPLQYLNILYFLISDIAIFHSTFTVTDAIGGLLILVSLLAPVSQTFYLKYCRQ
ncbi:unnamed protein product [Moneuplotes crassus]|uniref:EamA domain-containing protein n=1 Tax=Euplotes crassus TaxID=5936 RepID=A0AAD1XKT6_EUPCR|nr:unnamed protein product [Moneuplotes crassus]